MTKNHWKCPSEWKKIWARLISRFGRSTVILKTVLVQTGPVALSNSCSLTLHALRLWPKSLTQALPCLHRKASLPRSQRQHFWEPTPQHGVMAPNIRSETKVILVSKFAGLPTVIKLCAGLLDYISWMLTVKSA